ncbi:MAG TPA: hypothetical protein VMB84_09695, partial [Stellaceae bacterium]|nr:hypothetical protein [Stellaceae bacterium]
ASAIDPLVAPRLALLAIPGATADLVDDFLRSRATMRDLASIGAGMIPPGMSGFLMASPGRDFTISAIALAADGARYRADLQIRLTERAAQPYQVVAWRAPPVDRGTQRPPIARRVP